MAEIDVPVQRLRWGQTQRRDAWWSTPLGGVFDVISRRPARQRAYECVTWCNKHHMRWAWLSLVAVGFTDLYIRMVSMGVWSDGRIL